MMFRSLADGELEMQRPIFSHSSNLLIGLAVKIDNAFVVETEKIPRISNS